MKTVEDAKQWAEDNSAELDESRLNHENELVQMLNHLMPEMAKKTWNSGSWIRHELEAADADQEDIVRIQFAHGQRCLAGDPWEVAVSFVNEYLETGDTKEKGGPELAAKIYDEMDKKE